MLAIFLVAGSALVGCGDDDDGHSSRDVGGECSDNADCSDRCVRGPDWPGGMCTFDCSTDDDCPSGTYCIEREGGICAVACSRTEDCRSYGFDERWDCRTTNGPSETVSVCRGD